MGALTLVVGGQKSGKSNLAVRRAVASGRPVVVVTPAVARDDEFAARVARHRADRPSDWETVETFGLAGAVRDVGSGSFVIIDALDTWLAERMERSAVALDGAEPDHSALEQVTDAVLTELGELASVVAAGRSDVVLIAGQPGLGVHAGSPGSRAYVDLHGLSLQTLSDRADEVLLVVAGRVLPLAHDRVQSADGAVLERDHESRGMPL